jgi:hypothetical protein
MAKQKGMSFVEKAGLFFGIVGVLADFTALVSFAYGFASLDQFVPSHISFDSASTFFKWFSGLMIIYAWLIASWYFTRRSFVFRYEKPRGYKNPLDSRSQRTIFGIALFLFPTFVFWSIVNISISVSASSFSSTNNQLATEISPPTIVDTSTLTTETPHITLTPTVTETLMPVTSFPRPSSEEQAKQMTTFFNVLYYVFGLPFIMFIFGLVIYACINSLMPIVHVELLDDYE